MAANKQLDRLVDVIKGLEKGLQASIKALQKNIAALGKTKPPRKELVKALQRLRKALNTAILALEKKIGGAPAGRRPARRKAAR